MAAIIQLRLPALDATLGETVASVPGMTMEVEQFANGSDDSKRPLVWVRAEAFDAVERALAGDSAVAEHAVVGEVGGRQLYELAWAEPENVTFYALEEYGGHLRHATLADGEWAIELLFPTRKQLSRMYESRTDAGLEMTVDSIYELDDRGAVHSLTDGQQRTIETALAAGYYEVPRETTLTDLSDELDVSHQALSERLRRAHKHLATTALRGHSAGGVDTDPELPRS